MGIHKSRRPTITEQRLASTQQDLLAAQELAASLYEQNAAKDTKITDLQAAVASLYEGSASK
jgi:hypothetical protein